MKKSFPPPLPPAFRKGSGHAHEPGTWVTGLNGHELCGLPGHNGHVIVVTTKPNKRPKFSNSGYTQDCICMECSVSFKDVDGEFLQIKFRRASLEKLVDRLTEDVARKKKIIKRAREKSYEG